MKLKKKLVFLLFFFTLLSYLIFKKSDSDSTKIDPLIIELFQNPSYDIIDFENFDNLKGSKNYIVPNVVHLLYLNTSEIKFYQAINIYSLFLNHNPDFIVIHCDLCSFKGQYWEQINSVDKLKQKLRIRNIKIQSTIFGIESYWIEHVSDLWRLIILMNYGGIYLDNDVYVIKSLNKYRKFEMTLGWESVNEIVGSQVLIANRNARLLRAVFDKYRTDYNASEWYYNAGMVPADILKQHGYLAHTEDEKLGVSYHSELLYQEQSLNWTQFDSIHLLINHRYYLDENSTIKEFDEKNILNYKFNYGTMCRIIMKKMNKFYNLIF